MQCVKPKLIKNPHWTFGSSEPQSILVPCGHCVACRIAKTREWTIRLLHESSYHDSNVFITLTYDNDHIPLGETLVKKDFQLFMKRLRKCLDYKIKYYACGEYGDTTHRPHYHAILFGLEHADFKYLRESWTYGFVQNGSVTQDSIRYVSGYIQKKLNGKKGREIYGDRQPPFQLQSQGLGLAYVKDHEPHLLDNLSCTMNGVNVGLPRYYRKKLGIDTDEMAELAIKKNEEVDETWRKRGVTDPREIARLRSVAREQYELNLKARLLERSKI